MGATAGSSGYTTGRCSPCNRVFRWALRDRLQVRDARCLGCEGPLKRSWDSRTHARAPVEEVDADWLRITGGIDVTGLKF